MPSLRAGNPAAERLYGYPANRGDRGENRPRSLSKRPTAASRARTIWRRIATERAVRTVRDGTPAQGRHAGRNLAQPLADQRGRRARSSAPPGLGAPPHRCAARSSGRCISSSRNAGSLFDASQDLILIMNSRGATSYRSARAARAFSVTGRTEMIGRSGVDFIHPDHVEQSREEMRALRLGGHPKLADTRCFPQGRTRSLAVMARQLVGIRPSASSSSGAT